MWYWFGNWGKVKHQFMIDHTGKNWDDAYINSISNNQDLMHYYQNKLQKELEALNQQRAAQGLDPLKEADGTLVDFAGGFCEAADGKTYFLLQDNNDTSKKLLYAIECAMTKATVSSVRTISPDSHFAKASLRAFNSRTATIGYAVDNNKLYSYNLVQEETEKQLSLQGIPADEEITFVSNRYFAGSSSFDYLIIGTQKSGTYHLYFYNMVGGEPTGAPAFTISGEGKLKSLGYVNPLVKEGDDATLLPILDE